MLCVNTVSYIVGVHSIAAIILCANTASYMYIVVHMYRIMLYQKTLILIITKCVSLILPIPSLCVRPCVSFMPFVLDSQINHNHYSRGSSS